MEIALQDDSKGIVYDGYTKAFKQCIFEEGDVGGRNERYEFRCDYDLECCGRTCCIPEEATIPLWLMIIFIILLALILLAILATLAYLCAKRRKPKGTAGDGTSTTRGGYSTLQTGNGDVGDKYNDKALLVHEHDAYSTPDNLYGSRYDRTYGGRDSSAGGRGNGYGDSSAGGRGNGYGYGAYGNGIDRYDRREVQPRRPSRATVSSDGGSVVRHGMHETVEESFKQQVTYERPASTDSREML